MISSPQEIQQTPNYLQTPLCSWGIQGPDNSVLLTGSILVAWSVATRSSLYPIFNNPVSTYVGKISYPLYLVRGMMIKYLGYNLLPGTLRVATGTSEYVELDLEWWGRVADWQKPIAYMLGLCFVVPACFLLADLFWRFGNSLRGVRKERRDIPRDSRFFFQSHR
ncbi:uncharacterized protein A1O5_06541 [Cladophialophora psammophila CBS 110553]|uniref:Uncharacterized protein n=1 Tax=Cladophialophora psammophila CBS 110553 TaxID=1182543 RepID=W9WQK5_9EURO|nr:uncharacterized protein A1O5_06541 [Cladophialophora psammophila CBS 110553]EXJ70472.1 hypothetical protein A1O5_06541 [Cladophialophora psammophila CBS 110553]